MAKRPIRKSLFITFEGIDGCGKTTQLNLAAKYLSESGYRVKTLREPGSTEVSEKIRAILLDNSSTMSNVTELLLYEAARSEIVAREIAPLLKQGYIVLCDRFYDSTTAYQGYGRGLDIAMIKRLHRVAVGEVHPDLTLVFDLTLQKTRQRIGEKRDRLESLPDSFHQRVRNGFLEIARKESARVKVIDASRSPEEIFSSVRHLLTRKLADK